MLLFQLRALPNLLSFANRSANGDPIVSALARGDREASREVYVQHAATLRGFARRLLGDNEAAEDLVQDVFVALPDAAKRFRGDATLRAFLLGMTANLSKTHIRAAVRRRAAGTRIASEPPPSHRGPDAHAERGELARRLAAALDVLSHDQRVAFVLSEVEERTSAEVGRIVGATEETVRARVFHARKKLRRALAEQEEGP